MPSVDPSSTTTTSSPPSAATAPSASRSGADRGADAGRLVEGGHDDGRPHEPGGRRPRHPLVERAAHRTEQHGPVEHQPHHGGDGQRDRLGGDERAVDVEAVRREQAPQHDDVDQRGDVATATKAAGIRTQRTNGSRRNVRRRCST